MQLLEERIRKDGRIFPGDVLKVDSFLNHQMDVDFLCEIGKEFYRLFAKDEVNKILTIEASGIGVACLAAQYFHCPVVFAKKSKSTNLGDEVFTAPVSSYTHGKVYTAMISKNYLHNTDRLLIIDDFLARGNALQALLSMARDAGATVVGAGVVIEKTYQDGGNLIRNQGVRVESLAKIQAMDEHGITFA